MGRTSGTKTKAEITTELREAKKELKKLKEAPTFNDPSQSTLLMISEDPDPDARDFRPLTAQPNRNLSVLTQERQIDIAFWLYLTNGLAYRIIETTKNFIIGDGVRFTAKDPRVMQVLMEHWHDPDNNWDMKQYTKALELGLFGEQLYPVFVNDVNGHVKLGYTDPKQIDRIITDPENVERAVQARIKTGQYDKGRKTLDLIRLDEDVHSPTFGFRTGGAFYFAVNRVASASRGHSDLLPSADWLDTLDQFMMTRLEKAALANLVWQDCEIKGMSEDDIRKFADRNKRIKPGTIRYHNDKVKWSMIAPNLQANDASEEIRLFRNHILGSAGLPEHWFSEGGSSNRATAAEQGVPTTKMLTTRQNFFQHMIRQIFDFVIDQAVLHKRIPADADRGFDVIMAPIFVRDVRDASAALSNTANGLMLAEQQQWITGEQAAQVFRFVISNMGIKLVASKQDSAPAMESEINMYDQKLRRLRERFNGGAPEGGAKRDKAKSRA